jgi:3-hydroxyacyl-CoA dehydrogenase/enoyl-CoA hydratase/3-hydroxybutyryl-CoA epimerase
VITSIPDANIGSIMGIGFPLWSGGVVQFINGYDGGLTGFVARAKDSPDPLRAAVHAAALLDRQSRGRGVN